jgi:two-component system response regulator NreC
MPIRVLIADDHGVVRAGLRALLIGEPDLEVVGETASGDEAVSIAVLRQPDVVLMDVSMPGMDGIEAVRRLGEEAPSVRVLLLTVHEDVALLREALRVGVAGYVIKRAVESELINAIRAAAAGDLYVHPSMTRSLLEEKKLTPTKHDVLVCLTPREIDVLRLIAEGYTNTQIADRLCLSPRTVETHRANIRSKLQLDSRAELVRYAARNGLLSVTS